MMTLMTQFQILKNNRHVVKHRLKLISSSISSSNLFPLVKLQCLFQVCIFLLPQVVSPPDLVSILWYGMCMAIWHKLAYTMVNVVRATCAEKRVQNMYILLSNLIAMLQHLLEQPKPLLMRHAYVMLVTNKFQGIMRHAYVMLVTNKLQGIKTILISTHVGRKSHPPLKSYVVYSPAPRVSIDTATLLADRK